MAAALATRGDIRDEIWNFVEERTKNATREAADNMAHGATYGCRIAVTDSRAVDEVLGETL